MNNVRLDDEQVEAALERAAELEGEDAAAELDAPRELAPAPPSAAGLTPPEVEAIGRQAGIEPGFVQAAIAQAKGGMGRRRVSRIAAWMSGGDARALRRRRGIAGSPAAISAALASVVARGPHAFQVVHSDVAADGAEDVVLEVPSAVAATGSSPVTAALRGVGIRRVHLSLRATEPGTTEVVARGDWHDAGLHALASGAFLGVLGTGAGVLSAKLVVRALGGGGVSPGGLALVLQWPVRWLAHSGSAPLGALAALAQVLIRAMAHQGSPLGVLAALGLFIVAAAAGTLGGVAVARACSLWSLKQAGSALEKLLDSVAIDVKTRGRFRVP